MKVYFGNGSKEYREEHITMDEIKLLVAARLHEHAVRTAEVAANRDN